HENPALLDRLQLLREQVFLLNHIYSSLMSSVGSVGRLVVTMVLLASVHPLLLVPFTIALATVRVAPWRAKVERAVQETAGPDQRLARHLFEVGTTAGPAKEVRVGGLDDVIVVRRRRAWQSWYDAVAGARRASAWWYTASWSVFGLCYVGGVVLATTVLD